MNFKNILLITTTSLLGLILLISLITLGILVYYKPRVLPNSYLGNQSIANLSTTQIEQLVKSNYQPQAIELIYQDQSWTWSTEQLGLKIDPAATAQKAINAGKTWQGYQSLTQLQTDKQIPIIYSINQTALASASAQLADHLWMPAIEPEVTLTENQEIHVQTGSQGQSVDTDKLIQLIDHHLATGDSSPITIPVTHTDLRITQAQVNQAAQRATKLQTAQLTITADDQTLTWTNQQLIPLIGFEDNSYRTTELQQRIAQLAATWDRPAQNAIFKFDESTKKVKEFHPAVSGLAIDQTGALTQLSNTLQQLEQATSSATLALEYTETKPDITIDEINDLGIKEHIGHGESKFVGSVSTRLFNIGLASTRINGTIIPPGETFSFNAGVGEITAATGYKQSLIIKNGRTVLGDGGGVYQVSTTLFRAALNAGLPIDERRAHSFRVSYYEQDAPAGMDSTVFAPYVDLKFTNDTPDHILIQTTYDQKDAFLEFDLYGTSDGRIAVVDNHQLWDQTPPPPDLYQDDPSLPTGQVKQVERAIWGAKASFDWKVTRDGETIHEKTFYSNFHPWQAVYLRGTDPV